MNFSYAFFDEEANRPMIELIESEWMALKEKCENHPWIVAVEANAYIHELRE